MHMLLHAVNTSHIAAWCFCSVGMLVTAVSTSLVCAAIAVAICAAAATREFEETEKRIEFLQTTMAAQLKLTEEIHPDELAAHAGSPTPVAAAIAARRQQLAAVKEAHDR
jgi:hypothetical protein